MVAEARAAAWRRYGGAVAAVIVASVVTAEVPVLYERFTLFLFWPVTLGVAWLAGAGPAIVATALSALVVAHQLPPAGELGLGRPELVGIVVAFAVMGGAAAVLARWRGRADAALEESRDLFATLANSAPVFIWMSGPDKRCTYVNQPWLAFTGRAFARELGDGWMESVHPEDRAGCVETYSRAFDAGRPFETEYRLRRSDGEYRWVLDRGLPRRDGDGRLVGYIGSCTDVTEHRVAVTAAQEAREAAEAASRAKDAFLATVSHELRAPLSPILTWVRMLRGRHLTEEQTNRALEVIERNARMQTQLVEDLLDVARIVEGKLRLQIRPVTLGDVVGNAVDTVRPAADAKNIRLHVVLDTTVAPIPGDPDRLQQVVWNLLSNAVKFTPKDGRVHVVLERVNSHVEIAVSDTGRGIPAAQLPRLFERFWQADSSSSRSFTGLGLGLAIVRHLVELHGGTVTAESAGEGQGSTFTVKLPVAPLSRTAGEAARRHPVMVPETSIAAARLDGLRVLLVDDEPDSNEALRILLDQCGAEVRVAGSASHAVEIYRRWTPDVLVTDIGMPGEDGYALLAKIRAIGDGRGRCPAIALTAYASSEDRTRLLAAGFDLHVAKPADPGELTAAIAAVGRRHAES